MSFNLTSVLETIAPTLATMLGSPLAGTAVTALESAFGLAQGAGVDGITKVVQSGNMTPDIIAAVRATDQKHAELMKQMGVDLTKMQLAHEEAMSAEVEQDRNSARQREEVVKDKTPSHLAYMIIGGFFIMSIAQVVALMGFGDLVAKVPKEGWVLIGNLSGYLAAEAKAASQYYFGETAGSSRKTEIIAKSQPVQE